MSWNANGWDLVKCLVSNPGQWVVEPDLNFFLLSYLRKFKVRKVGPWLIVHSHLPPLNHPAYRRFIRLHLREKISGPSHAQIGVTEKCPQNCPYCYNRNRSGKPMDHALQLRVIQGLKNLGVTWLGITGGEPLLNPKLPELVAAAHPDCAVKLFTSGHGLTPRLAQALRDAGLFSVSVSLDHWDPEVHDRQRGFPGSFNQARRALDIFLNVPGLQVGASTVLSPNLEDPALARPLLEKFQAWGLHEAWVSEAKPALMDEPSRSLDQRVHLRSAWSAFQDQWNLREKMTLNYLGHFEDAAHFGCNAGNKMVYIDAYGQMSPCVFVPMSFGNVHEYPVQTLFAEMRKCFPSQADCFIQQHHAQLKAAAQGTFFLNESGSKDFMRALPQGAPSPFYRKFYQRKGI
jgi:MoaA/NifB/PqqE/SkfB family radical SAM enzyme